MPVGGGAASAHRSTRVAPALLPVRAEAVVSRAYGYDRPEWQGEALGGRIRVGSA
jgi:hypothetical protein